jgi:site-specific recombinase XerD
MLDINEIKILIDTAQNSRDKAIIACLFDSACRVEEFTNISLGELILKGNQMIICVDGKTGQREVPLGFSVPYLEAYLKSHPFKDDTSASLWISVWGKKLSKGSIKNLITVIGRNSRIQKNIHPHILRHSRLTDLAEKGMTETQMRIFAGWTADSSMPAKYLHLTNDAVRKKVYELDGKHDPIEDEVEKGLNLGWKS